nr:hypothetical protein [Xanthomonas euvesicatoria]
MDQPDLRAPDVRQPAWWRLCLASPEELAMMASLDGLRLRRAAMTLPLRRDARRGRCPEAPAKLKA